MHKLALGNLILARGDTFLYFYPYWYAAAAALRAGRVPLWNPDIFMGVPFLANSQVGFFYPLNWPLWLLLPTPYAVTVSIVLHLAIGGAGAYGAGRRLLRLGRTGALLTAVSFTLGGYVTAQVEHVNQLQGMAWLPWFFVVAGRLEACPEQGRRIGDWRLAGRRAWWLAGLFALQLLAGHTQTVFITVVGLGVWLLVTLWQTLRHTVRVRPRSSASHLLLPFVLGGVMALGLTAVQLLPTLELSQLSSRQGGLNVNEVLSFSWNPLLAAHSLLPAWGQSLFSEYVAFLPLTVLLLAGVGAWQWRQNGKPVLPLILLAVVGLLLALGQFNPLNWLLARLPGFNLFRAPARWLLLYTLAVSLLAGLGLETVAASKLSKRAMGWITAVLLLLIAWGIGSRWLAGLIPTGAEAPYQPIAPATMLLWLGELALCWLIIWVGWKNRCADDTDLSGFSLIRTKKICENPPRSASSAHPFPIRVRPRLSASHLLLALAVISLYLSSRSLPYNHPTTPEAFFDLRPPSTRLLAGNRDALPPDRFLSLSNIFFDPGDQAEIDTIYAGLLDEQARFDYTVAIKQKEIIGPNLPMVYGLPTVDGFDGGILPLAAYSRFVQAVLLDGQPTTDGRLREFLTAVPPPHWLDLLNVRYLITDKVGDAWREGVFFDLQHPVALGENDVATVGYVPPFAATELWLVASGEAGEVQVTTAAGETWQLLPEQAGEDWRRVVLPKAAELTAITLQGCRQPCDAAWQVAGLTLVDSRDGAFQPLVLGNYRLIHSGDVKIYENLDVLPRVLALTGWQVGMNAAEALVLLQGVDVGKTAVIDASKPPPPPSGTPPTATITAYAPERVVIATAGEQLSLLLLTDAMYPGWEVTVDGETAVSITTDALFRGVFVPAGSHEVVWEFRSRAWENGRLLSLLTLLLWGASGVWLWWWVGRK
ncbi:MAG: hypothetical protein R3C62_05115 [Chloroflexota bacterium]